MFVSTIGHTIGKKLLRNRIYSLYSSWCGPPSLLKMQLKRPRPSSLIITWLFETKSKGWLLYNQQIHNKETLHCTFIRQIHKSDIHALKQHPLFQDSPPSPPHTHAHTHHHSFSCLLVVECDKHLDPGSEQNKQKKKVKIVVFLTAKNVQKIKYNFSLFLADCCKLTANLFTVVCTTTAFLWANVQADCFLPQCFMPHTAHKVDTGERRSLLVCWAIHKETSKQKGSYNTLPSRLLSHSQRNKPTERQLQ